MVLQQLFPEYAMTDTRLQMKRPKELQQDGLGQVLSAHQAGLLPQAEAAALVHHQLGGVCHPQDEGDEKDEQPAEVAAAAGEDARSEAESSRSSKSVTSLVSSGSGLTPVFSHRGSVGENTIVGGGDALGWRGSIASCSSS
eukprot:7391571-Prymnesium_polylepis.3